MMRGVLCAQAASNIAIKMTRFMSKESLVSRNRNRGQHCPDQQNQHDVLEKIRIDRERETDNQEHRIVNAFAVDEEDRADRAEEQSEKERQRLARSMCEGSFL